MMKMKRAVRTWAWVMMTCENTYGFWLEMKGKDKHMVFHIMWPWKVKNTRKGKPPFPLLD